MPQITASDVSDEFWAKVEPLILAPERPAGRKYRRAQGGGRKPVDARGALSAILYVLRNRVSWRAAPRSFGSVPTIHRLFKTWQESGFFARLRQAGWADPEIKGIDWERADGGHPKPVSSSAGMELKEREASISDPRIQTLLLRLHGVTDAPSFWSTVQSLFRESIPSNSIVTYLDYFDHPNTWMAAKIFTTTNAYMPAEWLEKRWKLDITPQFLQSNPGIKLFRLSDIIADRGEFQNTDFFKQFFKPYGWHHTACLSYWQGTRLSSVIALRRTKEQGDYRPGEFEFFKKLHPHIETVLKRLLPAHQELSKGNWLGEFGQHLPFPLLLLDWTLEPVYINREALQQCAAWNFGPSKARAYDPRTVFRIPADIVQACKELKAQWLGARRAIGGPEQMTSRLAHTGIPGYSATITLQIESKDLIAKPGLLIYFDRQQALPQATDDTREPELLWRLTAAERDLVRLASEGYSNSAIALKLHKSVNTVKHQLTSIYGKLGVSGRRKRIATSL